jgi:hypothetical protein
MKEKTYFKCMQLKQGTHQPHHADQCDRNHFLSKFGDGYSILFPILVKLNLLYMGALSKEISTLDYYLNNFPTLFEKMLTTINEITSPNAQLKERNDTTTRGLICKTDTKIEDNVYGTTH